MKETKLFLVVLLATFAAACGPAANTNQVDHSNHANSGNANTNAAPAGPLNLTTVDTPQRIKDMVATRGEQDAAKPILKIVEPKANSTVSSSTVDVELDLSGDLKGYMPGQDPVTKMGNHIHVILDNQPYEAYYNIEGGPFELRNVEDGEHTLRVFASRPWHESYKNDGSFQMVKFTVKNGAADNTKPATTNSGQQMSNPSKSFNAPAPPSSGPAATPPPPPTPEGKDMLPTTGGMVDAAKPLLTYSRPKGEYKGVDADPIMIDFWLANAKLTGDGGEYHVRYSVNGGEAKFIDQWAPLWLQGWTAGKHTIKLELIDKDGNVVDNGGYNSTTREITVVK